MNLIRNAIIALMTFLLSGSSCTPNKENYILTNANIIDMESGIVKAGFSIVISAGKIKEILPTSELSSAYEQWTKFDLLNRFVIPGLIDGHVHTTAGPPNILFDNLKKTLESGVTTVRDMGGDGILINSWESRYKGEIPTILSTCIFAGNSWIKNDRRSFGSAHNTKPGTSAWLRTYHSQSIEQDIISAKKFAVDGIKIYADLDKEAIVQIAKHAKAYKLPVFAHATVYPATPMEVVSSGVQVISHAERMLPVTDTLIPNTYAEANQLQQEYEKEIIHSKAMNEYLLKLKTANIALDATLLVSKLRSERDHKSPTKTLQTVYTLTQKAYELGIPIIAGTDFMITPNEKIANLHQELKLLVNEAKLSNIDALRSATIIPSKFFQARSKGIIKSGYDADLVILNSNPLDNIENTSDIYWVIKSGKILK